MPAIERDTLIFLTGVSLGGIVSAVMGMIVPAGASVAASVFGALVGCWCVYRLRHGVVIRK